MKYKICLFIPFIILMVSCDTSGTGSCEMDYKFNFPINFSMTSEKIEVGDTIRFSLSYNINEILDLNSNETFNISDYPLEIYFGITWIDTTLAVSAYEDMSFNEIEGEFEIFTFSNGGTLGYIHPTIVDGVHTFELEFYSSKKGILAIGLGDYTTATGQNINFEIRNNCNESFKFYFDNNLSSDENFNLMLESPDNTYQNFDKNDDYYPSGAFVFVIE